LITFGVKARLIVAIVVRFTRRSFVGERESRGERHIMLVQTAEETAEGLPMNGDHSCCAALLREREERKRKL
jgi:hypothetical protein